jgi:hypothetical protein
MDSDVILASRIHSGRCGLINQEKTDTPSLERSDRSRKKDPPLDRRSRHRSIRAGTRASRIDIINALRLE